MANSARRPNEGLLIDDLGMLPELDPASYLQRQEEQVAMTITGEYKSPWNIPSLMVDVRPGGTAQDTTELFANTSPMQTQSFHAVPSVVANRSLGIRPTPPTAAKHSPLEETRHSVTSRSIKGRRSNNSSRATSDAIDLGGSLEESRTMGRRSSFRPSSEAPEGTGIPDVFRKAPSQVVAKMSAFVASHGGSGESLINPWDAISEMLETFRKAEGQAADIKASVKQLTDLSKRGLPNSAMRACKGRHIDTKEQNKNANDWESGINTAVALMDNLFGFLVTMTPALRPACEAVRETLCSAIYLEGTSYANAREIPTVKQACAASSKQALQERVDPFMLHCFGVESLRVLVRRHEEEDEALFTRQITENDLMSGDIDSAASAPVALLIKYKRISHAQNLIGTILKCNLDTWRKNYLRSVLLAWRKVVTNEKKARVTESELTRLRGEAELANRKHTEKSKVLESSSIETEATVKDLIGELTIARKSSAEEKLQLDLQISNLTNQLGAMKKDGNAQTNALNLQLTRAHSNLERLTADLANAENRGIELEERVKDAEQHAKEYAGTNAELSTIINKILRSLSSGMGQDEDLIAEIVSKTEQRRGLAPLVHFVTSMAQRTFNEEDVRHFLAGTAGANRLFSSAAATMHAEESSDGRPAPVLIDDNDSSGPQIHDFASGRSQIYDFTEGAALLDAYAAMLRAVDPELISTDDVLRVFGESDPRYKAQMVLDYGDLLMDEGTHLLYCGQVLEKPTTVFTAAEMSTGEATAKGMHASFVTQVMSYWLARDVQLEAPTFVSSADTVIRSPQEWLKELKKTSQQLEKWRHALVSQPVNLMTVTLPNPGSMMGMMMMSPRGKAPWETPSASESSNRPSFEALTRGISVTNQSFDVTVAKAEERMLFSHPWTRVVVEDLLKHLGGRGVDQVAGIETYLGDILTTVAGHAHIISCAFRFYSQLTSEDPPVMVVGPTEVFKMCADMGLHSTFSREDQRELFQVINGARKRLLITSSDHNSTINKADAEAHTQRPFFVTIEEFVPLLMRLSIMTEQRIHKVESIAPHMVANILTGYLDKYLPLAALLNVDYVTEESKQPLMRRLVEDNRKYLRAVFDYGASIDTTLSNRGLLSQSGFASLLQDMQVVDEAVTLINVNAVFLHSLTVDVNKPLFMCYSEFVVAMTAIGCMRFSSPFVQVPIKFSRFLSAWLMPYYRKRCIGHSRGGFNTKTTHHKSLLSVGHASPGGSSYASSMQSSVNPSPRSIFQEGPTEVNDYTDGSPGPKAPVTRRRRGSILGKKRRSTKKLTSAHNSTQNTPRTSAKNTPQASGANTPQDMAIAITAEFMMSVDGHEVPDAVGAYGSTDTVAFDP